ncbi:Uncharacterized protein GBIM_01927 [Gryllus bimaculatus]|nr:Uncharacterized protein GBIM_01927 [Gryllus bimaculatus]
MPFVQRVVEPVFLSRRNAASEEEENNKLLTDYELETVANTTLSNALRQLASLVLIANDIFDSLTKELEDVRDRSSKLRKRIEAVEGKVSEYDPKTVTVRGCNLAHPTPPPWLRHWSSYSRGSGFAAAPTTLRLFAGAQRRRVKHDGRGRGEYQLLSEFSSVLILWVSAVSLSEYLQLFMTILQEVGVDRLSKTLPTDHSGNLRRCRGPRKTEPN